MNYCPNCGYKLPFGNYTPPVQPYTPYNPYRNYPFWFSRSNEKPLNWRDNYDGWCGYTAKTKYDSVSNAKDSNFDKGTPNGA